MLREQLAGEFKRKMQTVSLGMSDIQTAGGNPVRTTLPSGFRRFWEQNRRVGEMVLTPEELAQAQRIGADFQEAATNQASDVARGSPTAQKFAV